MGHKGKASVRGGPGDTQGDRSKCSSNSSLMHDNRMSAERLRALSDARSCDGTGSEDCGIRDAPNSSAPKRTKVTYFVRTTIVITKVRVHEGRIHLAESDTVLKERRTARELPGGIPRARCRERCTPRFGRMPRWRAARDRRCQNTAEPKSPDQRGRREIPISVTMM
jgi:hypothetical protein